MGYKRKKWILRQENSKQAAELAKALGITPVVAQILINRGITTRTQGEEFFQCNLENTPDPFLMLGMRQAVKRIQQALDRQEPIVVYGDYDADGQTATALLVLSLRKLSAHPGIIRYYLPNRFEEGYGLNRDALRALGQQAKLLITVDCGISSQEDVAYANDLGLDVIVTDHHEPGADKPPAVAILNPKQEGCPYPFKHLCGVGVALKLVQALGVPNWQQNLDLVALGTVADLVPLTEENRTLVRHGLKRMSETTNLGLRALLEAAQVEQPKASDLGFRLGPRLNAAGRLGDPARGVRLLITDDEREAQELAWELQAENGRRQDLELAVLEAAEEAVEKHRLHERSALVVWGENWHQGVVGIVASRLVERYYLPTVVVSLAEEQATASARSIDGLNLYETLGDCADLLTKYGGHAMAAGLTLPVDNLPEFQRRFEQLCAEKIRPEDYIPKLAIDGTIKLNQLSFQLIEELSELEPHGVGNPGPLLQTEVSVLRTRTVGAQNSHLQLSVQDGTGGETQAIAFGFGQEQEKMEKYAERVALAFVPGVNHWRSETKIQLTVREWEPRRRGEGYVRRWMVDQYPWRLGASFFQSKALDLDVISPGASNHSWIDLRGTWDKAGVLQSRRGRELSPTLILANTPAAVLGVCRELRVKVAYDQLSIGFEHEYLSEEERVELEASPPEWLVSTGFGLAGTSWSSVWLWEPPLTEGTWAHWSRLCQDGGELAALYGPKDVRRLQGDLVRYYPDRQGLGRIYTMLREADGVVELEDAYRRLEEMGLLGALPVALGVFSELGLWEVGEEAILYLPPPPEKLDLGQTVLYNKVTKMRQASSQYLKRSLERGFFHDGLKREDSSDTRFSESGH